MYDINIERMVLMLFDEFKDKVIIVTGHTGFKGIGSHMAIINWS